MLHIFDITANENTCYKHNELELKFLYARYTPVFRRDVLWYGDVRPSVRPSVHPSVTVFCTFLLHVLTY